jgi:hypothetical protein
MTSNAIPHSQNTIEQKYRERFERESNQSNNLLTYILHGAESFLIS